MTLKKTLLLALAYLIVTGLPTAAPIQQVPPSESLNRSLEPSGRPGQKVIFNAAKSANVYFSLQDMTISTSWVWFPPSLPEGEVLEQDHGVPFRPTATQVIPGTRSFCVAGVGASFSPGGSTVIEKWTLGPPITKALQSSSGAYEYIIIPGPVVSRTTIFSDPQGVQGAINYFLVNHAEPGTLFLQFLNSRAVYKIDTSTAAMSLAVSGTAFSNVLGFTGMLEIDHPTKGFVYVVLEDMFPTPGNYPRVFVMTDSSRNGNLSVGEMTFQSLGDQGFLDGEGMNTFFEWPPWD